MPYTGGTSALPSDAIAGQGNPVTQFNQLKAAVVDARTAALPLTAETEAAVIHNGTSGGGTRPTGYTRVRWISPIGTNYPRPTNMAVGDLWEHDLTATAQGFGTAPFGTASFGG